MAELKQSTQKRTVKRVKKPKKQKVKQGHKLVWFTLAILILPVVIIGYVLLSSLGSSGHPVFGDRFANNDLNPKIAQSDLDAIQAELLTIPGVESATINMNSATLRVHLNLWDGASQDEINQAAETAFNIVNNQLPIDTYFTNTEESKNYDLEIDSYNYIIDEAHPKEGQIYLKITKTGAGTRVTDIISAPKNPELVSQIQTPNIVITEEIPEEQPVEEEEDYSDYGYYDEYGNFYYYE